MLTVFSKESVRNLGRFLSQTGYTVSNLYNQLGLRDLPHPILDNLDVLLYQTSGDTALAVLARLFFASEPLPLYRCRQFLPEQIVSACLRSGLLEQQGDQVRSAYALLPFSNTPERNTILACDAVWKRVKSRSIIMGPGESTILLSKFLVRSHAPTTLDLGTGTGVLAFEAASFSDTVIATDISDEAIRIANFNAALNDVECFSSACGDAFAPVTGRRFSRIIANPPFFLNPSKSITFCDSPMELDGFCRSLVRQAPEHLEEGGFFQMIAEWAQIDGQTSQERMKEWTASLPCDVLVLQGPPLTPVQYSAKRLAEAKLMQPAAAPETLERRIRFFQDRNVTGILGGIITMRKRQSGQNWFCIVPMPDSPDSSAGAAIESRFLALDYLASHSDKEILASRFRLTHRAILEHHQRFSAGEWQSASITLRELGGLKDRLILDTTLAALLGFFDGQRTVEEVVAQFSASISSPLDQTRDQCLAVLRRLLSSCLIEPQSD